MKKARDRSRAFLLVAAAKSYRWIQTEKLVPQPHEATALGFLIWKD